MDSEYNVKVLSLNCWGLFFATDYWIRLKEISLALGRTDYDFIFLQEIFTERDISLITNGCKDRLPYFYYSYSGLVGSGLLMISKYPLKDCQFFPFTQTGMLYHTGGDWFARKGISYAVAKHPKKDIHMFSSHLHPKFMYNEYECLRTLQILQFVGMVKSLTREGDAIIITGDLNTEDFEPCMKFFLKCCHLTDSCCEIHGDASSKMYTCNVDDNVYIGGRDPPRRIDYILCSNNLNCLSFNTTFNRHPTMPICYSDHKGVESSLSLKNSDVSITKKQNSCSSYTENKDVYDAVLNTLEEGRNESKFNLLWISIPLIVIAIYFYILFYPITRNYWYDRICLSLVSLCVPISILFILTVYVSLRQQRRIYKGSILKMKNLIAYD